MLETLDELNRAHDAYQLVEDFDLIKDAELFADPQQRINFLCALNNDDFVDLTTHINARMRGAEPRGRENTHDLGGALLMLRTPSAEEKPYALRKGFETIQTYLNDSDDSPEEKVRGAGMAIEALIIWVHPFNDGNGRTSRFLGKFIEEGTTDINKLVFETADLNERMRMYGQYSRVDSIIDLDTMDLLLDDEERELIKQKQKDVPITEAIEKSLKNLMENKVLQKEVESRALERKEKRAQSLARKAARLANVG